jgi:hypothetical protein
MMPPDGAAEVVAGATGAGAGVDERVGATVVVACTVTVLGAAVTVDTDDAAAVDLSSASPPPAIAAMMRSKTTTPMPPKIQGFFDFFGGVWGAHDG